MNKEPIYELIDKLNLSEERARELLDAVFRVAGDWYRDLCRNKRMLMIDKAKELLSLAKNKEEAYLVGVVADIIQTDLKIAREPFSIFERMSLAMEMLELVEHFAEGEQREKLAEERDE
jgi:hypothetical protein